MEGRLPEEVRALIRTSVPTLEALELLVSLVRNPERQWTVAELAALPGAAGLPMSVVEAFLGTLESQEILSAPEAGRYEYRPATASLAEAIGGLVRAYDQRPVTLIRTVYEIADSRRIQGLADAFRLKKDRGE